MPISPHLKALREKIGHDLVVLPSVAVMVFEEGRILLMRNADTGEWQTIGGMVDPDEHPADAAVREAREESGLEVELTRVIGVYGGKVFRLTYPNGDICSYVSILFEARIVGGTLAHDEDESSALGWFGAGEIESLETAPHTRLLVAEAFRHDPVCRFWNPD